MLKVIRHKGFMKKILWVLAVVIIISFGFFGQSFLFRDSAKATYAGKIFGQKVSIQEYDFNRTQTSIQLMLQYGAEYKKIAEFINIYAQTWDRIILLHDANRRRITVTDEEVVAAVQRYPFFLNKNTGAFDQSLYTQILNYSFRIQPRDFEEGMRDSLKIAKLYEKQTRDITIPDEEILKTYTQRNEKIQVSYGLVSADQYMPEVSFDEIQAKNYYLSHREEFMLPPMINVEFIRIDFPKNDSAATPQGKTGDLPAPDNAAPGSETDSGSPEAETSAGPDENAASDEAKEAAWQAAQELADAILIDNKSFETAAREQQKEIGVSGFFSLEKPNLSMGWSFPLIQQLFELPKDQVLGPVETPSGYQILRVKERRESILPDYPSVQDQVKTAWTRAEAKKIAQKKAEQFFKQLQEALQQPENPGFKNIANELGLTVYQTPLFQRGEYLPNIGMSRDFQKTAFALKDKPGTVSGPIEVEKGFCILTLDAYEPIDMEKYKKEKTPYLQELLQEKKASAFEEFMARLRLDANLEDHTPELYHLNKS